MLKEISVGMRNLVSVFQEQYFLDKQKVPSRENIRNFIRTSVVKHNAKPPFVDVACGYRTSKPETNKILIDGMCDYVAFDSFNLINKAEEVDAVQNLQADAQNISLSANYSETVICLEALEHISDDDKSIKEIRRILKVGGLLLLSIPGLDVPKHEKYYQKDYRRYTKNQILSLLARNGFKLIEYEEKYFESKHINTFITAR